MNRLPIDQVALGDKLTNGIANRPKGQSPEHAAKAMLPSLTPDETAVMVAIGADALAMRSRVVPGGIDGGTRHG